MALAEQPKSDRFEEALTPRARAFAGWFVAAALVILLALIALGLAWREYGDAKGKAEDELRARAILAATVFDTYFSGQISVLSAIAASPTVMSGNARAMTTYFHGFRPGPASTFTAGVGWIDLKGHQRATSLPSGPAPINLSDRTYFSRVVATKKPFISEAIVARVTKRRLIVMSVPTRDASGRLTGVLAGGLILKQSPNNRRANTLGYEGLQVVDRAGQEITRRDLGHPRNAKFLRELRQKKEGLLVDARGLDGSGGRVVAYADSRVPNWMVVLDQPTSAVFADARRTLALEGALIAGGSLLALGVIGWGVHRRRRQISTNRGRITRWAELTTSLNRAVESDDIASISVEALAAEFTEATVIVALQAKGGEETSVRIAGGTRASPRRVEEQDARLIAGAVASEEAPIALQDRSAIGARPELAGTPGMRIRSLYGVPLRDVDGETIGAAALIFGIEQALQPHQRALFEAQADQVAHALTRVRLHEQEHDVALLLQESLLPRDLPQVEGIDIAAFYRAGVANTNVGGDWYDVARRPDGIVHLTVGDVAGRGIEAAVAMGQLRSSFRAYALDHTSPAAVIERLGRHVEPGAMATTVCVSYDPMTNELACASAGHLPPLLVRPSDNEVARIECHSRPPLGWHSPVTATDDFAEVPLGSTLALYTDGLIERRGESIEAGIDRFASALADALPGDPRSAVAAITSDAAIADIPDDLALLLVRMREVPSRTDIELPADPHVVRELRRRTGIWLERRGLSESARYDAVLALSEACNNAIEHGYAGRPGTIRLRLEHHEDRLRIRVADNGTWREPNPQSTRGRGIPIMRGLMSVAEIIPKEEGTEVVLEQSLS